MRVWSVCGKKTFVSLQYIWKERIKPSVGAFGNIIKVGYSVFAVIVVLQISQVIYMGCLRGAGDTFYTAVVSTISVTIMRTAGSFFFSYVLNWGIIGIWLGIVADQISRLVLASIRFKRGKWMHIKI